VRAAILALLCFVAPTRVAGGAETDLPEHLALEDAVRIFRGRGYDLLVADAAVQSAVGDERVAGAVPNPNFFLGGSYSFVTRLTDPRNQLETPWGVSASLGDSNAIEDAISGKRGLRVRVARAALAAARSSRSDVQRVLEFQVKQQYMAAVLARDLVDFAAETQKSVQQTYELTHVRYQSGAISEADDARVETAKLEADQGLDTATQNLRTAKLALAFLLGVRGYVPDFQVAEDLPTYRVPPALAQMDERRLIDEALGRRPDLLAARQLRERAEAQLRLQRRLRFPDLNLNLSYNQQAGTDAGAATPPTFGVGIGGSLPLFYFQRGEILRAEADLRGHGVLADKSAAQVVSDVQTAWAHFTSNRRLVERMQSRLLDRAKRARDLVEIQYRKGAASLIELLDAQRQWIATNVEYYQDLAAYWTSVFEIEQATAMELR
jgi:cobalt-zinc-cadmium efflux system outer membrane protein